MPINKATIPSRHPLEGKNAGRAGVSGRLVDRNLNGRRLDFRIAQRFQIAPRTPKRCPDMWRMEITRNTSMTSIHKT